MAQGTGKVSTSPRGIFITSVILFLFFGVALGIRVFLPYDQVFGSDWVKFTGVDAYYHMRLVDNLVHNFPHLMSFDPFFLYYPDAGQITTPPFFDWLMGSIIWVISLGAPTQHTIDVVSPYIPAFLAALVVIPVYFIGKALFGTKAGLISAGLLAVLPGEFLGRTILGFTDHHVAEVLFTTLTMMFLVLAIRAARQHGMTFHSLMRRNWATNSKPIIYTLLAGLCLGIYLITWIGALLFVFIITLYFIIQFTVDHLRQQSTDYLGVIGVILFFIAIIMAVPFLQEGLHLGSLIIALLIPPVLSAISRLMASRGTKPAYYPLVLVGLGLAGLALLYIIAPSLLRTILYQFSLFTPRGVELATMEMQPLLFPGGNFTLILVWGNFTTSFFLSLISLGILIYLVIRDGSADKNLLVVWGLIILAATLGQRRFSYYFAVNVALLTGYLSWQLLKLAGFREGKPRQIETPPLAARERAKPGKEYQSGFHLTLRHINMALAVIVVFFLVFFPNIKPAVAVAESARFAPSDAWQSSLIWMKENTPEPFGDPNFYYQRYEPLPPGEDYPYPESAYGVMAWWDYGYWITRIAHRLPNCIPGGYSALRTSVAQFFLSQDEESAQAIREDLDSRYIIIDNATVTTKFWAMANYAGGDKDEFYEVYHVRQGNKLVPASLFYPEYYRCMSTRLYNFEGKAVTPEHSKVISYEERVTKEGKSIKLVTDIQTFPSYEEAVSYVASQDSANYRIVSENPFISPVTLEGLEDYRLIYDSDESIAVPGVGMVPEIKILEYVGHK